MSSSPKLAQRVRKISRSSEDITTSNKGQQSKGRGGGGLRNVASKFLGVVELDPATGDLHVRDCGSLQKDLDVATHVLEEGAVETAAIIEKGVLNPFTKLTKGLGAVLKAGQSEMPMPQVEQQQPAEMSPYSDPSGEQTSPSRLTSQNNQVANQLLKLKVAEASSQTKVLLL